MAVLLLGLGVILCAVGAKLALIQRYGTDQPFADQWAAEGMYFLRGPLYYKIDLTQITSLHSEHRPGLTRLWVRAGILANGGQWDCFVELVVNLLIYAAFLAVVWRWLTSLVKGASLVLAGLYMAVLFGLPCAYENFLWGFQSAFLFCNGMTYHQPSAGPGAGTAFMVIPIFGGCVAFLGTIIAVITIWWRARGQA